MSLSRRAFTLSGMGAATLAAGGAGARTRKDSLTLLVAQAAGGVTDVFARAVAPALARGLGRAAVVENVTGASGSMAASRLLSAVPDGNTLFVGSPSETVLAPLTLRAVRYKAADFRLLGLVNDSPLALYARRDLPANNLDELVALARSSDRVLSYGSTGQGSLFHLVTEKLLSAVRARALHVPYRSGGPLLTDLQAGTIDFTILPVDALLGALVAGGRMKVLGVSSAQRLARFPAAATFDESRSAPAFGRPSIWVGLWVPATMGENLCVQLHRVVADALGNDEVRRGVNAAGGSVPSPLSLAQAARLYADEVLKLQALARSLNVEPL